MKRHKDFWKITEDSLDKSIKVFDINPGMKSELLDLYKILSPYPEVKETLKLLKEKITNYQYFQMALLHCLRGWFPEIILKFLMIFFQ